MDYVEEYIKGCRRLAKAIHAYCAESRSGPTYFCIRAGVHQAALATVEKGTAKPDTVAKLRDYLEGKTGAKVDALEVLDDADAGQSEAVE